VFINLNIVPNKNNIFFNKMVFGEVKRRFTGNEAVE
jgi:hypothetical protein